MKSRLEQIMEPPLARACEVLGWDLQRQVHIGRYTLDLLIETSFRTRVCIELDGAEWHERAEDQGLRDRQRDRWLLRACGIPTIRFLGKEVMRNPQVVVTEIVQVIASIKEQHKNHSREAHSIGSDAGFSAGIKHAIESGEAVGINCDFCWNGYEASLPLVEEHW